MKTQDTPIRQDDDLEEIAFDDESEDEYDAPAFRKPRAEAVMGVIALLAAAVLLVLVVLCIPYFRAQEEEDPEALLRPGLPGLGQGGKNGGGQVRQAEPGRRRRSRH